MLKICSDLTTTIKIKSFFDSNSCDDNRKRRSTWAEERTNTDTFETPVCPNGGHEGYPGTVATKTEEASGFVAAEEMVAVTGTATVPEVDLEMVTGAKNLQISNTGKIIKSPYSLQTSL